MEMPPSINLREKILDVATDLFYREGIHAVGVDRIVKESGVAKMTLYNHFDSKDILIAEALKRHGEQWRADFVASVEKKAKAPRDKILAVFDTLEAWFDGKEFRGCAFINAAVELADTRHAGRKISADHMKHIRDYLASLTQEAGFKRSGELAGQLQLLVQGAIVAAVIEGSSDSARRARKVAATLLENA